MIAGAAGAGGAALAAFATSLGLLRQAKIQGDHVHQQWLRTQQQIAYEELLTATDRAEAACQDAIKAVQSSRGLPEPPQSLRPTLEEVMVQNSALASAVHRVTLLSEPVGECASELHAIALVLASATSRACSEMLAARDSPAHMDEVLEARIALTRARKTFLERARLMLRGT